MDEQFDSGIFRNNQRTTTYLAAAPRLWPAHASQMRRHVEYSSQGLRGAAEVTPDHRLRAGARLPNAAQNANQLRWLGYR